MSSYGPVQFPGEGEPVTWPGTGMHNSFDVETNGLDGFKPVGYFWNGEYHPWPSDI